MYDGLCLRSLRHSSQECVEKCPEEVFNGGQARECVYVWPSPATAVWSQLLLHKQIQCAAVNIDVGRLEHRQQQQPSLGGSPAPVPQNNWPKRSLTTIPAERHWPRWPSLVSSVCYDKNDSRVSLAG